ncbi:Metallo-dependent phosphatase-like protein [Aspergillus heterothallicus]
MASTKKSTNPLDALLTRPEQSTLLSRLINTPSQTLAQCIYNLRASRSPSPSSPIASPSTQSQSQNHPAIHIVCTSDTHNTTPALPDGDILIHAGDLTQSGSRRELAAQIAWLDAQPHVVKVVIAGNHELCLDRNFPRSKDRVDVDDIDNEDEKEAVDWKSLIYLQNESTTVAFGRGEDSVREIKIFGSPYTPRHGNWAFQYARAEGESIWGGVSIPEDTDILVTHGPPRAHLDFGLKGCVGLRRVLWGMKKRPRVHVFGHVHGGYGVEVLRWDGFQRAYEGVLEGGSVVRRWGVVGYTCTVWRFRSSHWVALVRHRRGGGVG